MKERILIDGNSVGHAAHQGQVLKAGDQETQAVYGTVRHIRNLRVRYPNATLLVLWDGKSWRKEISTVYKANREDDAKKRADRARYKSQATYIRRALGHLGIPQLFAINLEADDLGAIMSRRYAGNGDFVRLVTGDRDWIQLVQKNVLWEDHRDEARKVSEASFERSTGYATPLQYVQAKSLQGDTSDNLPGVGKIGEKGAADLLGVWGRVEAFLADPDPAATYRQRKDKNLSKAFSDFHANVDGRQEKFFHNMTMMNLLGDLPAPQKFTLSRGEFSPADFKKVCQELGFASIYRESAFENFLEPFQG